MTDEVATTTKVVAATDLLIPGRGYNTNIGQGSITLAVWKINISDSRLTLAGPIRLVGPNGQPMPRSSAMIVGGWSDGSGPAQPLASIAPRQKVTLAITIHVDCGSTSAERKWPERYPLVIIPFNNFANPWTEQLGKVFSDPGRTLNERVCD